MVASRQYEFGQFRLDTGARLLFRNGERVVLTPKVVDLLIALVAAEGKTIGKEDLLQKVWPGTVVEEGSLTSHISLLRKALGEGHDEPQFIETIPKRGYRFASPLIQIPGPTADGCASRMMLVVLPFENLSGGEKHDYFSEGLTEEMITQVARLSPDLLGVIARTSAMQYKSTNKSVQQIGRELGVSHLLEGSVRRAGDRVRITAQLIRVSDETHLWAESYERNLHDILALQVELARAIARAIQIKLTVRQQRRLDLEKLRSIDPGTHELYLRGRHLWNKRTEEGMRRSIQCFEQALERDPTYAVAYDGVSDAYTMLACRGVIPTTEAFHKAKVAARQALQIDQELGEAYASLAHVRLHDWDWVGLEEDFKRALELSPGHAIAWYWYAEYLMAMGRADEAIATARNAQEMDPVNPLLSASLGMILYLARRYDESVAELCRALEVDPGHFLLHFRLGLVYLQKGMLQAVDEMGRAVELSGRSTETLIGLAEAHGAVGDKATMKTIMKELVQHSEERYFSPYDVARAYGSLKDEEQTFFWLEKAYDEHNPDLIELKMEPSFDSVRSDARFVQLLRRVGFEMPGT
jgi:TolB-like protein/Tfp pilus assembly protein PilF